LHWIGTNVDIGINLWRTRIVRVADVFQCVLALHFLENFLLRGFFDMNIGFNVWAASVTSLIDMLQWMFAWNLLHDLLVMNFA